MSFQIDCPNCGLRPVWEFHYGGAVRQRPEPSASEREWADYLYFRPNTCGEETEWWSHRSACKLWFVIRRNTQTNEVFDTHGHATQERAGG
jgi:heterotetrameric sarcosine oxidase delta subunit